MLTLAASRRANSARRRGSMLIVAMGVLTLLSILAVTFVSLMRLELQASKNYVDGVKARLIAEGGLEKALAELKYRGGIESASKPDSQWNYADGNYWLALEDARIPGVKDSSGKEIIPADPDYQEHDVGLPGDPNYKPSNRVSFWGTLGRSYNNGYDRYKVAVIDAQTQFNLNNTLDQDTYIRWLSCLGAAIKINQNKNNPVLAAVYPRTGGANAKFGAEAIYAFRESREGKVFSSKSELQEILSDEDYRVLRNFVTTKSWFDRSAVDAASIPNLKTQPWSEAQSPKVEMTSGGRLDRAPINVNLAAREVLAANLAGLAGRGVYLHLGDYNSRATNIANIDVGTPWEFTGSKEEGEKFTYGPQGYIVYVDPFGYTPPTAPKTLATDPPDLTGAMWFADQIVKRRKTVGPFRSYAEWDRFVEQALSDTTIGSTTGGFNFPQYLSAHVYTLDHMEVTDPALLNEIRQSPRYRGFFNDCVRSLLKANANPNPRISSFNPNSPVYLPVDKGSLFYPIEHKRYPTTPPRQTCEWCFSPKGVFEVMALGEVLGPDPTAPYAQAKILTIVQLFDAVSHTSQRDFERNGAVFRKYDDRAEIVSYPIPKTFWDPRAALVNGNVPTDPTIRDKWKDQGGDPLGRRAHDVHGYLELSAMTMRDGSNGQQPSSSRVMDGTPLFALLMDHRRAIPISAGAKPHWDPEDNFVPERSNSQAQYNPPDDSKHQPTNDAPQTAFAVPRGETNDAAYRGLIPAAQRPGFDWEKYRYEMLYTDGFNTSEIRNKLLWFRGSDGESESDKPEPWNKIPDRQGNSTLDKGNCYPTTKGAAELWFKPEFDWFVRQKGWGAGDFVDPTSTFLTVSGNKVADERMCGLIGTSHVTENKEVVCDGSKPNTKKTRGTQMFVVRTTSGDLRITRLYYEAIGPAGSVPWAAATNEEFPLVLDIKALPGAKKLISIAEYMKLAVGVAAYTWPPVELQNIPAGYKDIKFGRVDTWVPAKEFEEWRAREWHHIAIAWDDGAGTATVWLDGTQAGSPVSHQIPPDPGIQHPVLGNPGAGKYWAVVNPGGATPPAVPGAEKKLTAFVRLNAKANPKTTYPLKDDSNEWPKDLITVGCVYREQAEAGGVFKFTKQARIPANGTLDDVRFFPSVGAIPATQLNRFQSFGYWKNDMDLSDRFGTADAIQLGQLSFTAYLPTRWAKAVNLDGAGSVSVELSVIDGRDGSVKKDGAGTDLKWLAKLDSISNPTNDPTKSASPVVPLLDTANAPVYLSRYPTGTGTGTSYVYDRLQYKIIMEAASAQRGAALLETATAGGITCATPVLDDISVAFYLPTQRILLKEKVND